ncbi:hypothetical protein [Actinomadura sp. HBU206391]|uniref:hypothetical protein n=1 Tax=Actinomadura sp. HBU206391 TaxID=2731692 RepID=UPI00164FF8A2|nr:hypothetical protein [Actinomadura sp. HBU206391]MBC6456672.1 hypothetical protein [Actinomadura sp. HBU206391]
MLTEPVAGVDAGDRRQGCGSTFAIVTVDFEPAEAYEFIDLTGEPVRTRPAWATDDGKWADIARSYAEELRSYKAVFADAMRTELDQVAIRVVLTRFVHHPIDSSERGFAAAARRAVRELHRRVPPTLTEPVRGVRVRDSGTYVRGDSFSSEITVDFEPADAYEFVDLTGEPNRSYAAAVDEALRTEIGTPSIRVVLTGVRPENVDERRFENVVILAVRKLRRHLRPAG